MSTAHLDQLRGRLEEQGWQAMTAPSEGPWDLAWNLVPRRSGVGPRRLVFSPLDASGRYVTIDEASGCQLEDDPTCRLYFFRTSSPLWASALDAFLADLERFIAPELWSAR